MIGAENLSHKKTNGLGDTVVPSSIACQTPNYPNTQTPEGTS
jgi:hypothetical protein